MAGQNSKTVKH